MQLAEQVAAELFLLEPSNASNYVTLGNVYAAAGDFAKANIIRNQLVLQRIKKLSGKAWTLVDSQLHTFYANDTSHPRNAEIIEMWNHLAREIKYKPDVRWVLQNESIEKKELRLCRHSEKLALCFALIATPPGTSVSFSQQQLTL